MRKVIEAILKTLAIVGILVIIGGVGTMDYMVTIRRNYPLIKTVITLLIGFALIVPAILYWGFGYDEK